MADYEKADLDQVRLMLDSVLHRCGEGFPRPMASDLLNVNEVTGRLYGVRATLPPPRCLAAGGCTEPPISSHALQRKGPLRVLERDGHVYMLKLEGKLGHASVPMARLVGTRTASTFPGLCARHDSELFLPIEGADMSSPTPEQLFLVSYRSMLCECYARRRRLAVVEAMARLTEETDGFSEEARVFAEELRRLSVLNVVVIDEVMKPYFEDVHAQRAYSEAFEYATFDLPALPFAGTAYSAPRFDLFGREIQTLAPSAAWSWLSVSALPSDHGTLGVISFAKCDLPVFGGLVETVDHGVFRGHPADVLLDLLLRNAEQVVFNPAWWESQPDGLRRALMKRWWLSGHGQPLDSRRPVP